MEKQIAPTPKKLLFLRSLLLGAMCFATLLVVVAAVKNRVFRETYIGVYVIVDLIELIFLTVLAGILLFRGEKLVASRGYFLLFLLSIFLAAFFSSLGNTFYQLPGCERTITALYTLSYGFVVLIYLTLWLYQKQFLEDTFSTRLVTVLISLTVLFYIVVLIINLYHPVLFLITEEGIYSESISDYISIITAFLCILLLSLAIFSSSLSRNRKFSFLCCIFSPILFATLSINQAVIGSGIYVWGLLCITILLPLSLIFFSAHEELENDVLRHEKLQIKLQISAMISQMQPHFLYNSLAVIAALCEENPSLAAEATNAFSSYLRENMNFADKSNPISFSEELNHIKTYVWLEQLRFPNKLKVEYEINCTAFPVPALSVQPMVENAIKHGICKSKSGGTVRISSFETEDCYIVTVSDDGTGFDIDARPSDDRQHLGIKNTRYRVREMVGGSLELESTPGEGTLVTITVPK